MANMAFVNIDELDADMLSLANTIRSKGNTTEKLQWPAGFESAVEAISTGPTIQRKAGTFTTNSSGTASVNCGFQPDVVYINVGTYYSKPYHLAFVFNEHGTNSSTIGWSDQYVQVSGNCSRTSNGFSITLKKYSLSWEESSIANGSFSYVAIKYTE